SLYSFGVLLAFTAAQLAVIRLRFSHPEKRRPYRVPLNIGRLPVPAVVGALLTAVVWVLALATHAAARYGGPVWLAAGLVMYVLLRHSRGEGLTQRVVSADEHPDLTEAQYSSILVPLKLGPIGEEMVATAVKLAQESGASVWALHVVRVPMDRPLDEELPEEEENATAALAEAQLLGSDHGVEVKGRTVRARSIGEHWRGGFVLGHGMDVDVLREAGIEDADAVVVATNGDNTNLVVAQVAMKRFDNQCVVVRILDPARADFYRTLGLRTVCPTKAAISELMDAARACEIPPREPVPTT